MFNLVIAIFIFFAGVWWGLMPYMLLKYRKVDLFSKDGYTSDNKPRK